MKVKIRGLAFVGFAAAVFAQSAMADPAAYNEQNRAVDEKTVTSKYYVDRKFSGEVGFVATQGANRGDVAFVELGDTGAYINANTEGTNHGGGVPVTGKAVAEAMNLANIEGDPSMHTQKVEVRDNNNNLTGYKVVVPEVAIAETAAKVVNTNAAATSGGEPEPLMQKDKLTTAGAVYDYAQPRFSTTSGSNSVSVGYKESNSDSTWTTLQTASATAGSQVNYVTMTKGSGDVYTVNLAADQIGTDGTGDNNSITSDSTKLTTGKAVYEFLNDQFQPKVSDDGGVSLYVGRWDDDANSGAGAPAWGVLRGATATGVVPYIDITQENGGYAINIDEGQLVTAAAEIVATNDAATNTLVAANASKLATASAVHGYAVRQSWGSDNANKTLVTDQYGNVALTTMPRIPELPNECKTNSTSVHCALVTTYYATGTDTIPAGTVVLEWTVMANPAA